MESDNQLGWNQINDQSGGSYNEISKENQVKTEWKTIYEYDIKNGQVLALPLDS